MKHPIAFVALLAVIFTMPFTAHAAKPWRICKGPYQPGCPFATDALISCDVSFDDAAKDLCHSQEPSYKLVRKDTLPNLNKLPCAYESVEITCIEN